MRTFLFKRKTLNLTLAIMLLTFTLAGAAFSQAITITTNEIIPFAQAVFVPCANGGAGEIVLVEGTLLLQGQTTIKAAERFEIPRSAAGGCRSRASYR